MAGLQTGTTFVDGNSYVAADLNNAVNLATPLPILVTQWSQKTTPTSSDKLLVSDAANSGALVYSTIGNIATGLGISKISYATSDTGAANAYVCACTPTIGALATGQGVIFKPANVNTTASTLNVDGIGTKNIYNANAALIGGELPANVYVLLLYDGTQFNLVSQLPAFTGDSGSGGSQGSVPAPASGDALANRLVHASGAFKVGSVMTPQGRLTLTTATPVLTSSATAQGTIYYTAYVGAMVPIYNGTLWGNYFLTATPGTQEISLALDSNSGHTGYHQSGKNFDLFIINNAGTVTLASGPAWSSDTARSNAISLLSGIYTNTSSIVLKTDTTSSTTTVAANQATYIGTFRASANGQTSMTYGPTANTLAQLFVWNAYNRVPQCGSVTETTDTWTYTTATWRSMNNNANTRINFIQGLSCENISALVRDNVGTSVTNQISVGIGVDATNANSAQLFGNLNLGTVNVPCSAYWDGNVGIGFHFIQALEISFATGTTTWVGDNGQIELIAGIMARIYC